MGKFLTTAAITKQLPKKGMYKILGNELYKDDDGFIYLVPRGFETDNFTWIKSGDWDTRCSHFHDVGCKYHQVIRLKWFANESFLRQYRFLHPYNNEMVCEDLPKKFFMIVDVSGNWINNLFYRMLKSADCPPTPKYIQLLYRAGVALNLNWFLTGKEKIDKTHIYKET